jgi:Ni,Fe-hydrogenase III small subunit
VDLWFGCPPHPLTVLDGLLRLLGRVESEGRRERVASAVDGE